MYVVSRKHCMMIWWWWSEQQSILRKHESCVYVYMLSVFLSHQKFQGHNILALGLISANLNHYEDRFLKVLFFSRGVAFDDNDDNDYWPKLFGVFNSFLANDNQKKDHQCFLYISWVIFFHNLLFLPQAWLGSLLVIQEKTNERQRNNKHIAEIHY